MYSSICIARIDINLETITLSVRCDESGHTQFLFFFLPSQRDTAHPGSGPAQYFLRPADLCSGVMHLSKQRTLPLPRPSSARLDH